MVTPSSSVGMILETHMARVGSRGPTENMPQ